MSRKGSENVVGPMPPHGGIVKSNDDMWKIIAWIWSINPPDKKAASARIALTTVTPRTAHFREARRGGRAEGAAEIAGRNGPDRQSPLHGRRR